MPESFTGRAERAFCAGEPGRAAAFADQAVAAGEAKLPALRVKAAALAGVLERTGMIEPGFARGATGASWLRRGPHGDGMCELVVELQRALFGLAAERESTSFASIFRLADALLDIDVMRQPRPAVETDIVVSMLCCERPELLRRSINDLMQSDLPPAEIVFFEDASRDHRVREILESLDSGPHRVHLIANNGFSTKSWPANQNVVIRYARQALSHFRWFVTCDADMALAPDWWSAQAELFDAFAGQRLPEGRLGLATTFHPASAHSLVRQVERDGVSMRIKETVGGCQLVIPRVTLDHVLGPLGHRSDWGWSQKLRAAGRYVGATMPSRAQHLGEESLLYHATVDTADDFELV